MIEIPDWALPLLIPIIAWTALWKGLALWHSARKADTMWFVVLVVVNTLSILELVYLYRAGKLRPGKLFHK